MKIQVKDLRVGDVVSFLDRKEVRTVKDFFTLEGGRNKLWTVYWKSGDVSHLRPDLQLELVDCFKPGS